MRIARGRYGWVALALLYVMTLTVASLLPSHADSLGGRWEPTINPTVQNALHFPAYAVLTALLLASVNRSRRISLPEILGLLAACTFYGAALEWLQSAFIPGRTGDWFDVLLNAGGGAAGCIVWWLAHRIEWFH